MSAQLRQAGKASLLWALKLREGVAGAGERLSSKAVFARASATGKRGRYISSSSCSEELLWVIKINALFFAVPFHLNPIRLLREECFMKENLYHAAKKYAEIIEKIERANDPKELQRLEEKRASCAGSLSIS